MASPSGPSRPIRRSRWNRRSHSMRSGPHLSPEVRGGVTSSGVASARAAPTSRASTASSTATRATGSDRALRRRHQRAIDRRIIGARRSRARPRTGPPGRRGAPGVPLLSRTTSATARRCSSVAWAAIRARASSSAQPALHQPGHPRLRVGLDDEHEVEGAGLAGLHEQRDVLDDDGVLGHGRDQLDRPRPAPAGARCRRAAARAAGSANTTAASAGTVQRRRRP